MNFFRRIVGVVAVLIGGAAVMEMIEKIIWINFLPVVGIALWIIIGSFWIVSRKKYSYLILMSGIVALFIQSWLVWGNDWAIGFNILIWIIFSFNVFLFMALNERAWLFNVANIIFFLLLFMLLPYQFNEATSTHQTNSFLSLFLVLGWPAIIVTDFIFIILPKKFW